MQTFYVYILANKPHGALYIGLTNDLYRRVEEHKEGLGSKHTARYNIDQLVYFAEFTDAEEAFFQERRMKKWKREYKINVIEEMNPKWKDIFYHLDEFMDGPTP